MNKKYYLTFKNNKFLGLKISLENKEANNRDDGIINIEVDKNYREKYTDLRALELVDGAIVESEAKKKENKKEIDKRKDDDKSIANFRKTIVNQLDALLTEELKTEDFKKLINIIK